MDSRQQKLIETACDTLGCSVDEILSLLQILNDVLGKNDNVNTALAIQIIAAGSIDKHAETMSPDSVWVIEIYPKLKEVL